MNHFLAEMPPGVTNIRDAAAGIIALDYKPNVCVWNVFFSFLRVYGDTNRNEDNCAHATFKELSTFMEVQDICTC